MPELIRTSPLTQREWQVLGLIYSGYSNEQIAGELEVRGNHHQDAYPQSVSETRRGPSPGCGTTRAETAEDDGIWGMSLAG